MGLCAFALRMPPPGYQVKGITIETIKGAEATPTHVSKEVESAKPTTSLASYFSMTLWEAITSTEFRLMYIMFIGAQITGLLIISKIQGIITGQFGKSTTEAANINSILGGCNLLGRLVLPLISDFIENRKILFVISCFVQALMLGTLPVAIWNQAYAAFIAQVFIIGFFYGSGFGIIPAFLADQFGSKNIGPTHGIILTAWASAGVFGGLIFTAVYNTGLAAHYYKILPTDAVKSWVPADFKYHAYDINFQWILAFVCIGFVFATVIPANLRDRRLPKSEGEVFRFRLGPRLVKFIKGKFVAISKEQEDNDWQVYLTEIARKQ